MYPLPCLAQLFLAFQANLHHSFLQRWQPIRNPVKKSMNCQGDKVGSTMIEMPVVQKFWNILNTCHLIGLSIIASNSNLQSYQWNKWGESWDQLINSRASSGNWLCNLISSPSQSSRFRPHSILNLNFSYDPKNFQATTRSSPWSFYDWSNHLQLKFSSLNSFIVVRKRSSGNQFDPSLSESRYTSQPNFSFTNCESNFNLIQF